MTNRWKIDRQKGYIMKQVPPERIITQRLDNYNRKHHKPVEEIPKIQIIEYDESEDNIKRWYRKLKKLFRDKLKYTEREYNKQALEESWISKYIECYKSHTCCPFYENNLIIPENIVKRINKSNSTGKIDSECEIIYQLIKPVRKKTEKIESILNSQEELANLSIS